MVSCRTSAVMKRPTGAVMNWALLRWLFEVCSAYMPTARFQRKETIVRGPRHCFGELTCQCNVPRGSKWGLSLAQPGADLGVDRS